MSVSRLVVVRGPGGEVLRLILEPPGGAAPVALPSVAEYHIYGDAANLGRVSRLVVTVLIEDVSSRAAYSEELE